MPNKAPIDCVKNKAVLESQANLIWSSGMADNSNGDLNDNPSSTLGPTPKVKTLSDLTSAIANAFGENPEGSAKTQKDKITAAIEENTATKLLYNPDKCENALFGNGGALNYSFDAYWESVAPKDASGSPIAQPTETQYVHRFKTGQEPRQADAGFETWKNQNQDWTQAYKAHHTLLSTAKDVIQTSRSVQHLVLSENSDRKQPRAKHRELIQRTNKVVEASVSAKYLASAYSRSNQSTNWIRDQWKTMQAQKETGVSTEKNMATLLSMPCENEDEALKLLEKADDIMENAFKDMGLTPLPNGGYRLPPSLNNTKGVNHVLKAMSAKSGGYRTYSVTMGGEMRIKSPASIIEQAIDSHFEEGGTPYAVETSGKKSSGQKYETAMQWLKSEMDKPANVKPDSPKLKDCTPTVRAQIIADKLDAKINNAAGKPTPADKIVLKSLQRHQVNALSRTKFAEQKLENAKGMQEQVQNVCDKTPDGDVKQLMQAHLRDLNEHVTTLSKTHEDLKGQEQKIKDKITTGNEELKQLKPELKDKSENKENSKASSGPKSHAHTQNTKDKKNKNKEKNIIIFVNGKKSGKPNGEPSSLVTLPSILKPELRLLRNCLSGFINNKSSMVILYCSIVYGGVTAPKNLSNCCSSGPIMSSPSSQLLTPCIDVFIVMVKAVIL